MSQIFFDSSSAVQLSRSPWQPIHHQGETERYWLTTVSAPFGRSLFNGVPPRDITGTSSSASDCPASRYSMLPLPSIPASLQDIFLHCASLIQVPNTDTQAYIATAWKSISSTRNKVPPWSVGTIRSAQSHSGPTRTPCLIRCPRFRLRPTLTEYVDRT